MQIPHTLVSTYLTPWKSEKPAQALWMHESMRCLYCKISDMEPAEDVCVAACGKEEPHLCKALIVKVLRCVYKLVIKLFAS